MIVPGTSVTVEIDQCESWGTVRSVKPWPFTTKSVSDDPSTSRGRLFESLLQESLPWEVPADIRVDCPDEMTWESIPECPYIGPRAGYNDTSFDATVGNELKL